MTYEEFIAPFEEQIEKLYEAQAHGEEDVEYDNEAVLQQMWAVLDKDLTSLGHLRGTIDGGGISWMLDTYYYLHPNPLDGQWHLLALWYDDNWERWQFNDAGSIEDEDLSLERAAYQLLKQFAEEGTNRDSIEDREDLIEKWRCLAEGEPVKPSRASARRQEYLDGLQDALDAAKPSCGDAQLSQKEFNAFMGVVAAVHHAGVKSDQPVRLDTMRDMVKTIEGQVEAFDAFLAHGDGQVALQNVIVNCQVLEHMREPKRVFVGQQLFMMVMASGQRGAAFELVGHVFQILGIGVGSTAPLDMLKDVTRLQEADSNVDLTMCYRPSWPFMPWATGRLELGDGVAWEPLSSSGVAISWIWDLTTNKAIVLRLNVNGRPFVLTAESHDRRQSWPAVDLEEAPNCRDVLYLLAGGQSGVIPSQVPNNSPLAWLVSEVPIEFGACQATIVKSEQTIVDEMEVGGIGNPGIVQRYIPFLSKRRAFRVSSNYHRFSAAVEMLFSGRISG